MPDDEMHTTAHGGTEPDEKLERSVSQTELRMRSGVSAAAVPPAVAAAPLPLRAYLPGLVLIILLGLAAYWLASLHPSLDALALAIMLGITLRLLLGSAVRPERERGTASLGSSGSRRSASTLARPGYALLPGAHFGGRVFIPLGIILYGVNLDFTRLVELPLPTIALTLLCMAAFYILIFWLNSVWGLSSKLSELIATGSAICGASAIAVLSPSVEAEPEDTSVSLLVITAAGLLGVMTYPLLKELLVISDRNFAVLSGATLHQTGLVRVAVSALPADAANLAMAVKTLRIVMLAPVALVTGLLHAVPSAAVPSAAVRRDGAAPGGTSSTLYPAPLYPAPLYPAPSPLRYFRTKSLRLAALAKGLLRVWFLLPFIGVGLLISFVPASQSYLTLLKPWATLAFAIGLGSIGFMVDVESVLNTGSRPLLVGLLGWLGVIMLFFVLAPFLL